jgi:D-tagatose-1,6-bisphosphate aldolase subunit GatZ/KbaZ
VEELDPTGAGDCFGATFVTCRLQGRSVGESLDYANSTDYQPAASLAGLVSDGFAILKVGPRLTFALREALYGLDQIATALYPSWSEHSLVAAMEREMLTNPRYWQSHYRGDPEEQRILRHFSYSDRTRYYWASSPAQDAVRRLLERLTGTSVPAPLISQFLPTLYPRVANGTLDPTPRTLVLEAVRDVLRVYAAACGETKSAGQRSNPGSGPE